MGKHMILAKSGILELTGPTASVIDEIKCREFVQRQSGFDLQRYLAPIRRDKPGHGTERNNA